MYTGFEIKKIYLDEETTSEKILEMASELISDKCYVFEIYFNDELLLFVDGFNNKCDGKLTDWNLTNGLSE